MSFSAGVPDQRYAGVPGLHNDAIEAVDGISESPALHSVTGSASGCGLEDGTSEPLLPTPIPMNEKWSDKTDGASEPLLPAPTTSDHVGTEALCIEAVRIRGLSVDARVRVTTPRALYVTEPMAATIRARFPTLDEHACMSHGTHRFSETIVGTETPHLMEHIAIDLLVRRAGTGGGGFAGHTSWLNKGDLLMRVTVASQENAEGVELSPSEAHGRPLQTRGGQESGERTPAPSFGAAAVEAALREACALVNELVVSSSIQSAAPPKAWSEAQPAPSLAAQPVEIAEAQPLISSAARSGAQPLAQQPAERSAGQSATRPEVRSSAQPLAQQPDMRSETQPASSLVAQPASSLAEQPASSLAAQPTFSRSEPHPKARPAARPFVRHRATN